ncbi:DEAD-domain-containing protein [Mycena kentingensis (nom. inval.)]|nr:DEAD-domain-containing protein [Mycena kentingensis (nom. inval.)]
MPCRSLTRACTTTSSHGRERWWEVDTEEAEEDEAEEAREGEVAADDEEEEEFVPSQRDAVIPTRRKNIPSRQRLPFHKSSSKRKADAEYRVTRGVDFIDVACVLNFDLPRSARAYTHRVGRTARAGADGDGAVSSPSTPTRRRASLRGSSGSRWRGSKVAEYRFDMKQVEAFRYWMEDALQSVTRAAVREARVAQLKAEILASDKLKAHFEDNPLY